MRFIYYVLTETFDVRIVVYCHKNTAEKHLQDRAERFVRSLDPQCTGNLFKDDLLDEAIPLGYFLRHSTTRPGQIDVYRRQIKSVFGEMNISCEKIAIFSILKVSFEFARNSGRNPDS